MAPTSRASSLSRVYAWFSAVTNDDIPLLQDLLAHGVPIDTAHPLRHSTALMEATRRGSSPIVQWLLDRGASPAFLCGLPLGTALHCAVRRQHFHIADTLANAMSSCAVMDAYGASPLHCLSSETIKPADMPAALELATLLMSKNCPLNALDHEGTTALHHCVFNGHYDMAALLLRYGANPNALIPDSQVSPLTIAALENNLAIAKLLISYGADPHARNREGSSPSSICPAIGALGTAGAMMRAETPRNETIVH